jgi:hypothetical protein
MMMPWPVEYTFEFGGAPQDVTIATSGYASAEGLIGLAASLWSWAGVSIHVDHVLLRQLCVVSC